MKNESTCAEVVISIECADNLVSARQQGKDFARELGLSPRKATLVAAAISELARNIIQFAGRGEIRLRRDADQMLYVIASDAGPGIADIQKALEPGFSTNGGVGLGLRGVQRIADQFRIASRPGATTVTIGLSCQQRARPPQYGATATSRRYGAKPANEPAISADAGAVRDKRKKAARRGGQHK